MIFRKAKEDEKNLLFKQGYTEWSKNRSFTQYCQDNSQEDAYGTRYVLEEKGEIVSSAILLDFQASLGEKIFGIGSVLTPPHCRGKGYARKLLKNCIDLVFDEQSMIFLYSDIDPGFYEKLKFRLLPAPLQKYEKSPCLVLCHHQVWQEFLRSKEKTVPNYF